MDRLENLLIAAGTAIADAQTASMAQQADLKPSTAATILTLGQHAPLTLSQLAGIVAISHSATVRLVDSLAARGLVQRGARQDRREVAVSLTVEGRALYDTLRRSQGEVLRPLLQSLEPAEKAALESILSRILATLTQGRESADHICRFCDEYSCGQDDCPVELKAIALTRT